MKKISARFLLVEELLKKIGIHKDFTELLKKQIGKLFHSISVLISLIALNIGQFFFVEVSISLKILVTIFITYPILLMFIPESTYVTIVRKV